MDKKERQNYLVAKVEKFGGSWVCVAPEGCSGDGEGASFNRAEDIERFLDWWSSL